MGLCFIDPVSQTPKHVHENEEAIYILKGKGIAKIEGDEYIYQKAL